MATLVQHWWRCKCGRPVTGAPLWRDTKMRCPYCNRSIDKVARPHSKAPHLTLITTNEVSV